MNFLSLVLCMENIKSKSGKLEVSREYLRLNINVAH